VVGQARQEGARARDPRAPPARTFGERPVRRDHFDDTRRAGIEELEDAVVGCVASPPRGIAHDNTFVVAFRQIGLGRVEDELDVPAGHGRVAAEALEQPAHRGGWIAPPAGHAGTDDVVAVDHQRRRTVARHAAHPTTGERCGTTVRDMPTDQPKNKVVADATAATERTMRPQRVPVNVYETTGALVIISPLPAVTADDVTIELQPGTLRFWASLRSAPPREYLTHEWEYGGFEREVEVPDGYGGDVEATLANGQLAIRVLRGTTDQPVSIKPNAL
jgi:HSP20 family molecular chaperone IbpA